MSLINSITTPVCHVTLDVVMLVAGRKGLVGSAVVPRLHVFGRNQILTASNELVDLRDQGAVT